MTGLSRVRIVDDPSEIEGELSDAVDQNDGLRSALGEAAETISLQDETIKALTEDRYALGTVLSFQKTRLRDPKVDELTTGKIVCIKNSDDKFGRVVDFNPRSGRYQIELFDSPTTVECYGNSSAAPGNGSDVLLWRPSVVRVAYEGKVLELPVPPKDIYAGGQTVRIQMDNMQVCSAASEDLLGEVVHVMKLLDERTVEVTSNGSNFAVRIGATAGSSIDEGDEVILDRSGQIILKKVGKAGDEYLFTEKTGIDWDDIGGLETAKRELREAIELPHAHPKAYEWLKMTAPKGVLLYGPPGCGKTLLGKAVATSLSRIYTGEADARGFFYVRGPEFLQRYVGDSEAKVREVFSNARKFKEKYGYPAVIFIDEAESILRKRGSGISSDVENTIVPMFLTMMDGLSESGAIVMLTTNRPDMLDSAVLREGRIDRKILITRPNLMEAEEIFRIHLKGVPLNAGDVWAMASAATNELFSPHHVLYEITRNTAGKQGTMLFLLGDLTSGAMIAEVCKRAKALAFTRYVESGTLQGVSQEDLQKAIEDLYQETLRLKHNEALEDFVADYKDEVTGIRKLSFRR